LRAFVAEVETFDVKTLNDFAVVSPAIHCQSFAAFTSDFFWWASEMFGQFVQMFTVVFIGSIYVAGTAVETTTTNQIRFSHEFHSPYALP